MLQNFEYGIKRCFRATDSRAYSVDLKGVADDLARGIDDETITVSVYVLSMIDSMGLALTKNFSDPP
jgi:hypothetical protein